MNIKPYVAIAALEFKHALIHRSTILVRFFFYGLVLMLYSRLWEVTLSTGAAQNSHQIKDNIWYLAITELIILALPHIDDDIVTDVKSGRLAYLLARPVNYWVFKLAGAVGVMAARMMVLCVGGFGFAILFAQGWPSGGWNLAVVLPICFLASLAIIPYVATIGVLAFWLHDPNPIYWVWHKFLFILGGLILPITLYPAWLQKFALLTPFAAFLFRPGSFAFESSPYKIATTVGLLAIWGALGVLLLRFTFQKASRSYNMTGG